ncbi:MAG: glycoside hydrolase family 1 protein [Candidatus Cryosericum sp.]
MMESFLLPESFLLGTATASLQIEGGDRNNSWYRWVQTGHVKDGSSCIVADDHWNRVTEDIALLKQLHEQTYRMSLEWSRIEPARGQFDKQAMDHYRLEIQQLVDAGIRPLVTLHHFSNPLWLEDAGAWLNPDVVGLFERYTAYVVENLGDLVSDWCTINEPNVYLANGYVLGGWPPSDIGITKYFRGARNMICAHIKAYRKIHEIRSGNGCQDTMVGVANHLRLFDPKHGDGQERWAAGMYERLFQDLFITGMCEGRLLAPLGSGYPLGEGRYFDFFGVNYYTRDIVGSKSRPTDVLGKLEVREGSQKNDLGWEIYAEGLNRVCKKYWERYHTPIFITENGTADAKDAFRTRFIYDHLFQVSRLIDDGVDVQRYYYWSLMDNFEWIEGLSARFGIVAVDFATLERTIRTSGWFYADIAKHHGVTEKMLQQYFS